ncbi:fimbrial protein [Halomonas binhaiensis]|uniref:Fimbrial protein n=1 Tax=Halomonas binhaiensis TaxID=2562282 RepID=A0A5C1NMQ7_9GAMM|nr:fimbrial protein [Halomonas binhaiensis]QEM83803.1 fimbrial protein [Halomonas binhaiensis]
MMMLLSSSHLRHSLAIYGCLVSSISIGSTITTTDPLPEGLPVWQCASPTSVFVGATEKIDGSRQVGNITSRRFSVYSDIHTVCHCPRSHTGNVLYTATASQPETNGWLKLNDNLSARVIIHGNGLDNQQVPFFQIRSSQQSGCFPGTSSYGPRSPAADGQVEFRVDKSFLGESHFSGELSRVYRQFQGADGGPAHNYPFARINADISVKTTQNCSFRAGNTFTVDLGSTPINHLKVGAPPELGYIPRQIDLSVNCDNISDSDIQGLEFFATAAGIPNTNGPYIATSKPGIGVAMTDVSGNLLGLGMENSEIHPLQGGSSLKKVQFYPTIVPGQKSEVTPGPYNATVTITVTIP